MSSGAMATQEELREQLGGRPLLLFDGQCGFCHSSVQWLIRHDHRDRFRFAPQESQVATSVFHRHGINCAALLKSNSIYMAVDAATDREQLLTQSDVSVNILLELGGRWRVLGYLLRAVPKFLRDAAYRTFARNRYRLGERYQACPVPTNANRMKFIT
ncbi:MAG: DCC1-like thiol-disulfide oxidoreductase family protein [Acidobacteriaceae bacterium]